MKQNVKLLNHSWGKMEDMTSSPNMCHFPLKKDSFSSFQNVSDFFFLVTIFILFTHGPSVWLELVTHSPKTPTTTNEHLKTMNEAWSITHKNSLNVLAPECVFCLHFLDSLFAKWSYFYSLNLPLPTVEALKQWYHSPYPVITPNQDVNSCAFLERLRKRVNKERKIWKIWT